MTTPKYAPEILADIARRLRVAEGRRRYLAELEQATVSTAVYEMSRDEVARAMEAGIFENPRAVGSPWVVVDEIAATRSEQPQEGP